MKYKRALIAVAAVALVPVAVIAAAHAATTNATCTQNPVVSDTGTGQRITVVCTVPKPPAVTVTVRPTATVTPSPSGSASATPTPSPTPTPTVTPTPSPTPTVAPAPSGFPDASSTGYRHAPGYTGTLKPGAGLTIQSGQTYVGYDFPGGVTVGTRDNPVTGVTFVGCRFHGATDVLVTLYGSNLKFSYSSFEPSVASPPSTYNQGYQYGISADGAYYTHAEGLSMDHLDVWGFGNAISVAHSTQSQPLVLTDSWIHDARADGGIDHTDGIGELNGSGMSFVTIDHNTIESVGNTNGIAFQYGPYSDFTVTNNLIGGWGYAVAIGAQGPGPIARVTFTGNTWSTRIPTVFGPTYPANFWTGNGNMWRSNRWADGRYWTPTGPSATDYTG